jgi:stearoyl-CoA desaturase (delta-9 desaturase)
MHKGFFWSHMGWILCEKYKDMNPALIRDFMAHRELVWLNFNTWLPANLYIGTLVWLWGLEGFLWGFGVATVFLWHGTFTINSLVHVWGTRPYDTGDNSRNNVVGAVLTLGDGWHNNHHHYPISVRHGFHWWQLDPTYYALCLLERLGLVWDLKRPVPARIAATSMARA